ncbi:hypothetical protein HCZ23_00750 [Celeribacter sp. HF31]|uniref:hypothetical protein n=1 Tax=Celeribacter sp. HF31 TaxID=2721558 RepID=UPI0014304C24|nr:hypothetical protein [Celeribacter sp. HF31]NIY78000.1 hypothetical protein [Celeribacter sp. HF31]
MQETEQKIDFHPIEIELLSRRTNKTTQLINNDDPTFELDARKNWYNFEFEQPVYVLSIEIHADGYNSYHKFELIVDHMDGTQFDAKIPIANDTIVHTSGKLAKGFKFRPEERILTKTTLHKVVITGLTLDEFHDFEWQLKEYDKRLEAIELKEAQGLALDQSLELKTKERKDLESQIGIARAEITQLEKSLHETEERVENAEIRLEKIRASIKSERSELSQYTTDKQKTSAELHRLKDEVKLFPSEISGFVSEGNRSTIWYTIIGVPFTAIIALVTYELFSSAVDLTQLWRAENDIDIWTVFLTRLPFVIIALTILEVCGYIVGRLIFEVMRINQQRLSLSKLSIIAKDVSTATAQNTELSDDERYEREVQLKMELLREHMKEYVGEDFSYKGTAITSALTAIANRVGRSE